MEVNCVGGQGCKIKGYDASLVKLAGFKKEIGY